MKIEKLFKKDINRDIQGVVTIGNEEESRKKQELEEYVCTQEVIKNKITDDDYSTKSPANLLDKLIKLRTTSENDLRARKIRYTWRGNNLNE